MTQTKKHRVNQDVVKAFVTLLTNLPEVDRRAIFGHFESQPAFPSMIGLARVGASNLTRSELIDYCKRIEFCYLQFPGHPSKPFVPFSTTRDLAENILEKHGEACLKQYVEHLEDCYTRAWQGFSRPERIREHFRAWHEHTQKSPPNPTQ
jgi:hypothetical protein